MHSYKLINRLTSPELSPCRRSLPAHYHFLFYVPFLFPLQSSSTSAVAMPLIYSWIADWENNPVLVAIWQMYFLCDVSLHDVNMDITMCNLCFLIVVQKCKLFPFYLQLKYINNLQVIAIPQSVCLWSRLSVCVWLWFEAYRILIV